MVELHLMGILRHVGRFVFALAVFPLVSNCSLGQRKFRAHAPAACQVVIIAFCIAQKKIMSISWKDVLLSDIVVQSELSQSVWTGRLLVLFPASLEHYHLFFIIMLFWIYWRTSPSDSWILRSYVVVYKLCIIWNLPISGPSNLIIFVIISLVCRQLVYFERSKYVKQN